MSKRSFQFRTGGWVLLAAVLLLPVAAMAQDVTDGRPTTFMDYFRQGGFIMWPLLGMAIWATAIVIEMLVRLRKKVFCPDSLMTQVSEAISVGDYQKAWNVSSADPSPLGRVLAAAVAKIPKGRESVEEAGVEAAANENSNFKIKLSYVSLVAAIGPMVGLFGTISGMIGAFNSMAFGGAVGDPTKLAGDIGEALITTYGGLVVAIPAMMAYFMMLARLKIVLSFVQHDFVMMIDMVNFDSLPSDLEIVTRDGVSAAPASVAAEAEMVPCPNCKNDIQVGVKACPHCNTEMDWE